MLSYPYIESLFRAVLDKSTVVRGRFHVCPKWGAELNASNLDEVVKRTIGEGAAPKYPLAILMPPRSESEYQHAGTPDTHRFLMLFLTTTHYTGANQVKSPHPDTGKSLKPTPSANFRLFLYERFAGKKNFPYPVRTTWRWFVMAHLEPPGVEPGSKHMP